MRKAERLFQIVQRLRRGRVVTAAALAEELEVSVRTVYRDMDALSVSGVPIISEAGVGYTLAADYDLPPVMFSVEEVEALALGARMAIAWADADLARSAREVLAKVEAVLPQGLRRHLAETPLFAPNWPARAENSGHMPALRAAINARRKVRITYADAGGEVSDRVIHPLGMFFWGKVWTLGAWCELRVGFRNFRLDRILTLEQTSLNFETVAGQTLQDYFQAAEEEVEAALARAGQEPS